MLLLHYALRLRAILRNAGVEMHEAETLGIGLAARFENWRSRWDLQPAVPAPNKEEYGRAQAVVAGVGITPT